MHFWGLSQFQLVAEPKTVQSQWARIHGVRASCSDPTQGEWPIREADMFAVVQ
jgi:hypothetical protein